LFDSAADLDQCVITGTFQQISIDFEIENQPYTLLLIKNKDTPGAYLVLFGHRKHRDPLGKTGTGRSQRVYSVVMWLMRHMVHNPPLAHEITCFYWSALGENRQRLYQRLMLRVARDLNWHSSNDRQLFPGNVGDNEHTYTVYKSSGLALVT
jgi:hypothetical protein